jgi:hypothetical protein
MRCFLCGDPAPFWGERCPSCGHDKTVLQVLRMVGGACLLGGAGAGAWQGGFLGALVGGLTGGVFWIAIEVISNQLARQRLKRPK